MKEKGRKSGKNTFPPSQLIFLSSGTEKVSGRKGHLLQEFRDITGNKPCTEEPAVDKKAEMDGMDGGSTASFSP